MEKFHQSLEVCDTSHLSRGKAIAAFREALASLGFPWRQTLNEEEGSFSARHIGFRANDGAVSLINVTPHTAVRGPHEIANSGDASFVCLAYMISGEALIHQFGRDVGDSKGDLLIFDLSEPIKIQQKTTSSYEVLTLNIPKSRFATVKN